MKKLLLSLVALAIVSSAAFAQLSGGLRLGLNLANQSYKIDALDIDENGDMKLGLSLGLYLTGNLSDKIALQPELVFNSFGASDTEGDGKTVASYISIPVLLRYNINEMINIHLGPQFGILASAKYKLDDEDEDVKDSYKGLDTGAAIGIGLDFGKINAGLRYYTSLGNIADADGFEAKNTAIQIVAGYKLFGE
jgi:hypothetical protein